MVAAAAQGLVPEVLSEYGELVRRALDGYLRSDSLRFHYDLVGDYPQRPGRMLRPGLAIAAARAFGAPLDSVLPTAAAIELLHNAFLVHDDIEDGSLERRGQPTMQAAHGVPIAVNVGDALALLSQRPLLDNMRVLGPRRAFAILEETHRTTRETVEGQAIELHWRDTGRLDVSEADYLEMVMKKTSWYTVIFPCRAGAMVAGHMLDRAAFVRFGFFLGAAFQLQDDLLNLDGDHQRYGKELLGDIIEAKRTLPLIHLRNRLDSTGQAWLDALYLAAPEERKAEAPHVKELMLAHGSIDYARQVTHALAGAARHEFELAFAEAPPSRDREFIGALPQWVIART